MAPPNLKKMLQIKIKPRQDSYSDQFSRILMVKMLMLTAAVTGITWMKDKITCVVPKNHDLSGGFVSKACWINGLYIYRDLPAEDQSYYYGIPSDIAADGVNKHGSLCSTDDGGSCDPLEKTFYLQYQWFPLAVAALSFLYYLPYLLFRVVNADMQGIKDAVKGKKVEEVEYDVIIGRYFDRKSNSASNLRARVGLNLIVKVLYVVTNVLGLLAIDSSLNGDYIPYGGRWSSWTGLSNAGKYNYIEREEPKAGNRLLPGFGMCQVQSSGQDIKHTVINVHTYVCELSQHVLYQYILICMWYMFIFGIIISIIGLLKHMYDRVKGMSASSGQGGLVNRVYKRLTSREVQYMEFIRKKNFPVYGELIQRLDTRSGFYSPNGHSQPSYNNRDSEKDTLM